MTRPSEEPPTRAELAREELAAEEGDELARLEEEHEAHLWAEALREELIEGSEEFEWEML